ncbi:hypothetical protein N656DRAFT_801872 [Canariomyces notabilis]|uniref:Uncharacterized protein n=1 Tax=Canariomyces notabilis TaxID=2074819 RepID=A0AAN6QIV4_9PEZI|nr:hypothetical protein N656DRAFT_801872 [Canariomyces arenarius]
MPSRKWTNSLPLRPLPSVALARFTTDIYNPLRSYHDPFPADEPRLSVTLSRQNVNELVHTTKTTSSDIRLTELLSLFRGRKRSDIARVEATLATQYELAQWKAVFCDACGWKRRLRMGRMFFFIFFTVGYRTFVDAVLERGEQSERGLGVNFSVPVSSVVEANVMVPGMVSLAGTLDPGVGGSVQKAEERSADV